MSRVSVGVLTSILASIGVLYYLCCCSSLEKRKRDLVCGKIVMITGASSGLGKELAYEICRLRPKRLILTGRNVDRLNSVRKDCLQIFNQTDNKGKEETSFQIKQLHMDKYESHSFQETVNGIIKDGGVDVLINNAGVSSRSLIVDTTLELDKYIFDVNYFGTTVLTKLLLPSFLEKQSGHIVCINSAQGKVGIGYRSSYGSSKHALAAFFDTLRAEVRHQGISVLAVFPGYIKTNLSLNAMSGDGEKYDKMDKSTENGADPAFVAKKIMASMAYNERELIVASLQVHLVCVLRNVLSDLCLWVFEKRAEKVMNLKGNSK